MRTIRPMLLLLTLAVILFPAPSRAAHFEVVTGDDSEIVFVSKAPLESFKGRTRQLSGWFDADLDSLAGPISLEVEVDLASFDTGMKKRNTHMRENHLETDKYAKAWFRAGEIVQASVPSLATGKEVTLLIRGTLDLHGVQKEIDCELLVSRGGDGSVAIEGEFPVLLSDFNIDRPKFLVMKLADQQLVQVKLMARSR